MVAPLLIIDAANVVGSVPDGWWRDRAGATERLRDRLSAPDLGVLTGGVTPELVLVVEGQARGVTAVPGVRVVAAPGSGDDEIVSLVAAADDRTVVVATADRELISRVTALGASIVGPKSVR
ncbi:NTP pyrophosphohydrolase [Labedaea rhizosphaerae]|uniref:NTP pyrophosphohydrolase n=1 Tax=Labedaea rhizosphaerae TaxID=598644 RepID=A0A4R6SP99_LABRH|nr:NTP pyrophosphohydrolase [Labedaea rhizosphaerae]TDQ05282.1 hypothetical protein EV186_1011251 [Labedaea rhizosphaerae]